MSRLRGRGQGLLVAGAVALAASVLLALAVDKVSAGAAGSRAIASAATTFTVNSLGDDHDSDTGDGVCATTSARTCTLRAAIEQANAMSAMVTVNFVVTGQIDLSSELVIRRPVTIAGPERGPVLLSGGGATRHLRLALEDGSGVVSISNLTLVHGVAQDGGSVWIDKSGPATEVVFSNVEFLKNAASQGGGAIYNFAHHLKIVDSVFEDNTASINGGALVNEGGALTVERSRFAGNRSDIGGAVDLLVSPVPGAQPEPVVFDRAELVGNVATRFGGALHNAAKNVIVRGSIFRDNSATAVDSVGGAIDNFGGALTLERSTVARNVAGRGGGVFNNDRGNTWNYGPASVGTLAILASTLLENRAVVGDGGALYSTAWNHQGVTTAIYASTVVSNSVEAGHNGGGVYSDYFATTVVQDTILAGNRSESEYPAESDCFSEAPPVDASIVTVAGVLSGGNNLVTDSQSAMLRCPLAESDIRISAAELWGAVLDRHLTSYDGSQPMLALLPEVDGRKNPAIDRILPGGEVCGTAVETDQRGAPMPMGVGCDIGAYETASPKATVSTTFSFRPGSCPGEVAPELARGVWVYPCAVVMNTGNVTLTAATVVDPDRQLSYTLERDLLPGEAFMLTKGMLASLEPVPVTDDFQLRLVLDGFSSFATPPGIERRVEQTGTLASKLLDQGVKVDTQLVPGGALRTVTVGLEYARGEQRYPTPRRIHFEVTGATAYQPAPQTSRQEDGRAVFKYFSPYPEASPATHAARRLLAPEAVDTLIVWTDFNGNGYRDPFEPYFAQDVNTAIDLAYFAAAVSDGEVRLTWRTGSELDLVGFKIRRSTSAAGPGDEIATVPATGDALGAEYAYIDRPPAEGTYYYWLEEIETDGEKLTHGPLRVMLGDTLRVLMPMVVGE